MFEPLHTERLVLRPPRFEDVEGLAARRNEPAAAEFQDWTLPFDLASAKELIEGAVSLGGPTNNHWWMIVVADRTDGTVLGDLAVHLSSEGQSAQIGYTFAVAHWGRGYATEAVAALVGWLFNVQQVSRVSADLHPENHASAMVLERSGLLFEGRTRLSDWVGEQNSDALLYGMAETDWQSWIGRGTQRPGEVELVELDVANNKAVLKLSTHKSQERFVAPMTASFADALYPEIIDGAPVVPWLRGVLASGDFVGFVMLAEVTDHHPEPYLWRLLIDRMHQRRGIGSLILDLVVEQCRAWGSTSLVTSWVEGKGSPRPFYEHYGFVETGEVVDGETEGRLRFQ